MHFFLWSVQAGEHFDYKLVHQIIRHKTNKSIQNHLKMRITVQGLIGDVQLSIQYRKKKCVGGEVNQLGWVARGWYFHQFIQFKFNLFISYLMSEQFFICMKRFSH